MSCNQECGITPDVAKKIADELVEIRTRVHIYLGNGKDGLVPEKLKAIEATVAIHDAYIAMQKGFASGDKTAKSDKRDRWTLRIAAFSSLIALAGMIYHLWRMS